jgi:hypothetical protein
MNKSEGFVILLPHLARKGFKFYPEEERFKFINTYNGLVRMKVPEIRCFISRGFGIPFTPITNMYQFIKDSYEEYTE